MLARLDLARRAGLDSFGEPVTYAPAVGGPFTVTAVWRGPQQAVSVGGGDVTVSSTAPAFGVDLGDFVEAGHAAYIASGDPKVLAGDTLTRDADGQTYRVDDVQPDGQGGATLILHLV